MARTLASLAALAALLAPLPAQGRDLAGDGALALRTTLKSTLIVSRPGDDPLLPAEPAASDALFRLRLDLVAKPSDAVTAAAAWETRLRATAPPGAATGGILPAEAAPPFRLRPLDEPLATADGLAWRHELDRAFVAWRAGPAEVTAGRQAIGWGRGVLFGAVDLFAPFSPLEADRAWRRGVDALRADVKLGERLSVDAVAALGRDADPDASIFAARVRGYAGRLDGELVAGLREREPFVGLASSAAIGDAEGHVELALFRTAVPTRDPLLANDRLVVKVVVGVSHRIPLGGGVPVFAEYHYSGEGGARQAVALLATYEANEEASFQLLWLASPRDGSGVFSPTATLTVGDRTSVQATAYIPHGAGARGGVQRTDLGATPLAVLVQLAVYD
jgi:hypothetical protein